MVATPTKVFFRDVFARTATEVQSAHAVLSARECNFKDVSPEQRAWLMGARAMAAWVLGLERGGRKIAELVGGVATAGVVDIAVGTRFLADKINFAGGFNTGG